MKVFLIPIFILVAVAGLFTLTSAAYILPEGQQVVITQFGAPVGQPITEAGLHFKLPFIQDIRRLEKRLLTWDGDVNQIPTRDQKYIMVDTTARWRIVDAIRFIQSVQTESRARDRIDAILDSETRNVISNNNLVESVRNSNTILDLIEERLQTAQEQLEEGLIDVIEEAIIGDVERVRLGREALSEEIIQRASSALSELGIELIDVQLRRVSYEQSVEKSVYERMISERQRIAEEIRSIGQGEKARIQGKTNRDLQEIQSRAYRTAQKIRGEGDSEAMKIYAGAISRDANFYEFLRTLEAYENSLSEGVSFLLSTDSAFLKLLQSDR